MGRGHLDSMRDRRQQRQRARYREASGDYDRPPNRYGIKNITSSGSGRSVLALSSFRRRAGAGQQI
jgi:homoserine kinase